MPSKGEDRAVATMSIDVTVHASGSYEVVVPEFNGDEYARTFASTAREALGNAGQYVESVLGEFL